MQNSLGRHIVENSDSKWSPWSDAAWKGSSREKAASCYFSKVFYFFEGRNAWHWTWSSTYPGDDAFCPSIDEAKKSIQSRRVQGSTWTIRELPALIIEGGSRSVVICQINSDAPFASLTINLGEKTLLKSIGDALNNSNVKDVKIFACSTELCNPTRLPLLGYRSVSHGGNYLLSWNCKPMIWNLSGIFKFVEAINNHLQKHLKPR